MGIQGKKLTRSLTDRRLAGVCGGIAEYLEIDSMFVRVLFIILLLCVGGGGLAYLLCWILMPEGWRSR